MLTDELLIERAGNFTASENHRLMAGWDAPELEPLPPELNMLRAYIEPMYNEGRREFLVGEMKNHGFPDATGASINLIKKHLSANKIPEGLRTYAEEKATEELFHFDPSLNGWSTPQTRNGEEREIDCMEILSERTGLHFVNTGEDQAHIHADGVGCTPDGIVLDDLDLVLTGAEVKCKSPLGHSRDLLITDQETMMYEAFDHFVQVQTAMLVTDTDHWYFANYNPFAKHESIKFNFIIIYRDNEFIKKLKQRIDLAKKIKNDFIAQLEQTNNEIKAEAA